MKNQVYRQTIGADRIFPLLRSAGPGVTRFQEIELNQKRLLLVEDESDLRMVMADSLSEAGFKVLEAEDGDQAVALLEDSERIDILVTDIQMPGRCDGNEVAARFRASHLDFPVIYTSGKPESLTNSIGQHDVFVAKPCRPSTVIAAIQRLLNVVEARG